MVRKSGYSRLLEASVVFFGHHPDGTRTNDGRTIEILRLQQRVRLKSLVEQLTFRFFVKCVNLACTASNVCYTHTNPIITRLGTNLPAREYHTGTGKTGTR